MNFLSRFFKPSNPEPAAPAATEALQLPCQADLWCRKRTSISMMLDPELFDRYKTDIDAIDEDWIIQSNPPCAFKAEYKEGCDALMDLLAIDPGLHATKGYLNFALPAMTDSPTKERYLAKMKIIVRTAERELKTPSQ